MKIISSLLLLGSITGLEAATIAATSFENETPGTQYQDTGDPAVDHALLNNPGQSPVNSTVASELGYTASYQNTLNGVGLTDGDFVGISNFTGDVGAFTDGVQGYQLSDTDGQMTVTFAAVDLTGETDVVFSLDYFANSTGWEIGDLLQISLTTDLGTTFIINTIGSDIDDLMIEGRWVTASIPIPDAATTATATVSFTSNSASESLYLDNVRFEVVPEPSTSLLVGLAIFGLIRRRR